MPKLKRKVKPVKAWAAVTPHGRVIVESVRPRRGEYFMSMMEESDGCKIQPVLITPIKRKGGKK